MQCMLLLCRDLLCGFRHLCLKHYILLRLASMVDIKLISELGYCKKATSE